MGSRKRYKHPLMGEIGKVPPPWEDNIYQIPTVINPNPEKLIAAAATGKPHVIRKVEWRSPDGKMVVVAGPFPRGFYRSDTRDSVLKASKMRSADLWAHEPTSREDQFAKCLAADVVEIYGGENEFGTVIP